MTLASVHDTGPTPTMMGRVSDRARRETLVAVTLQPSALARAGVQSMLLVVAAMVIVKASGAYSGGATLGVVAMAALAIAVALPFAFDLWAYVRADADGLLVRNRIRRQRVRWEDISGFEPGVRSMVARRTDGSEVELRAVGFRYFGSRRLARERLRLLERVHASAASGPAITSRPDPTGSRRRLRSPGP